MSIFSEKTREQIKTTVVVCYYRNGLHMEKSDFTDGFEFPGVEKMNDERLLEELWSVMPLSRKLVNTVNAEVAVYNMLTGARIEAIPVENCTKE